MSIFYITGKPRGGKSFMAIKALCQELADKKSERFIVTNLPLKFDDYEREEIIYPTRWQTFVWMLRCVTKCWRKHAKPVPIRTTRTAKGLKSWCSENAPHVTRLQERIRLLEDDETGEFWLFEPKWEFKNRTTIKVNRRGTEIDVPSFKYEDGSNRGDENAGNPGTLYIIDEIHLFFPSRAWQRTGEDATFFLSQHGKLKCDVIMVTQHPEQCDKALRRLAQEYMTVRNLSREPIMGFRLGNFFRINRMLNPPSSPNPYIFDSQFVGMNFREYGDLYDTSAGVGVSGTLVPNKEKRGRSLWWLLLIPIIAIIIFYNMGHIATGLTKMTTMGVKKFMGVMDDGEVAKNKTTVGKPQGKSPAEMASQALFFPQASKEREEIDTKQLQDKPITNKQPELTYTGYVCFNGHWTVWLSDGSSYESGDGELQQIKKKSVTINGKEYKMSVPKIATNSVTPPLINIPAQPIVTQRNIQFPFPSVQVIPFGNQRQQMAQVPMGNPFAELQQLNSGGYR